MRGRTIPGIYKRYLYFRTLKNLEKLDSWAIPFNQFLYWSGALSVVPKYNQVKNTGFGIGSTHTRFEDPTVGVGFSPIEFPLQHPEEVRSDERLYRKIAFQRDLAWILFIARHPVKFVRSLRQFFFLQPSSKNRGAPGA